MGNGGAALGRVAFDYGTGAVLPALEALGEPVQDLRVRKAVDWIAMHQNQDGGWGESCANYAAPTWRGCGASTASQTAWALLALMAAGEWEHPTLERGLQYLAGTQNEDGSWDEPWFTGTGFPGYGIGKRLDKMRRPGNLRYQATDLSAGFMIKYHMYRIYWPLMALGRHKRYRDGAMQQSTAN
ncbi:MAG: hypothetical protein EXR67_00580 [Dehalococcoidia bacterium]|nr:hypothetical protein [Dehalococcoidia bacterium]